MLFINEGLLATQCIVGLMGPAMLVCFAKTLSRDVAGLDDMAKGGALLTTAAISIGFVPEVNENVASYMGCMLLLAVCAYWYAGLRKMGGLEAQDREIRWGVALYSVGLGIVTFGIDDLNAAMAYNCLMCGMGLVGCIYSTVQGERRDKVKKYVVFFLAMHSGLFLIQGAEFAREYADGAMMLRDTVPHITIAIYTVAQAVMVGVALMALDEVQRRLEHEATTDSLTGLLIRREMTRRAEAEVGRCQREGKVVGCLMLDIDHFKKVNDRFGHQVGDLVIADFAKAIKGMVRPYDIVGRQGGEEFVVILPHCDKEALKNIGERIRQACGSRREGIPEYTASVGMSWGSKRALSELIEEADKALYLAKSSGRNRVCMAQPEQHPVPTLRLVGQLGA